MQELDKTEYTIPTKKYPRQSEVEMTELVLPNDTNLLGNLLGGTLMHWIDLAGAMAASKHANSVVATVAMDSLDFRKPSRMGEMVKLKAKLTWTGKTSMEVTVMVYSENIKTGKITLTNRAYLTFVALGEDERPISVPILIPETQEEQTAYIEAEVRRNARLKQKAKELQ